jgi:cytidylate kinase
MVRSCKRATLAGGGLVMKAKGTRSMQEILDDQLHKWKAVSDERRTGPSITVITISREPGSGGREIAERLAHDLEYDLFAQELIGKVAESAKMRDSIIESLDEKGHSFLKNLILSLTEKQHLWPYEYLNHLIRIVGAIAIRGHAVILGRGAQFILPPAETLRVRVVSPVEMRVKNLSHELNISLDDAKRRVARDDADREAFARKYFNARIDDPSHYDLVINSWYVGLDAAVETIKTTLNLKKIPTPAWKK